MEKIQIRGIPAIVYGEPSGKLFLFIHGKMGRKEDAEKFAYVACLNGYQVLSFDLPEHGERTEDSTTLDPWHVVPEFKCILSYAKERWDRISIYANSLGAYFSLLSFAEEQIDRCMFVSPILDMERLIGNMMKWSGITEEQLKRERSIPTNLGETLSWEYLTYVREHRITRWNIPTSIMYGSEDNLTEREIVNDFVGRFDCELTILDGGEHWFHTPDQVKALEQWIERAL